MIGKKLGPHEIIEQISAGWTRGNEAKDPRPEKHQGGVMPVTHRTLAWIVILAGLTAATPVAAGHRQLHHATGQGRSHTGVRRRPIIHVGHERHRHRLLKTTMIYTHVLNSGTAVQSPADRLEDH